MGNEKYLKGVYGIGSKSYFYPNPTKYQLPIYFMEYWHATNNPEMVGDLNKLMNLEHTQMSKRKGQIDKYLKYNYVWICDTYYWIKRKTDSRKQR